MARCFVTRKLPGEALSHLAEAHEVDLWEQDRPVDRAVLLERAAAAEGLLCTLTDRVDAELLDACPELRAIANFAVGVDNIDLAAARERGIPVGNTPGVLTETTADLAFALILACARGLPGAEADVRAGRWTTWSPEGWLGRDVHGATLGIVGAGAIGMAVARRAEGFGMEVLLNGSSPGPGRVELAELLERSDFVSLHCPLTEETRGLIGKEELRAMRQTAILVNTARGPIIDQPELRRALARGWIAGAGLDVTDPEPLPADDPLLLAPNLIVLPHIGSATHATREAMASLAVDNLLAGLAGEPMPHSVA
ncbi:MAG: D-glycerate dehydrogenase [Solirubrobacterales bacterium]